MECNVYSHMNLSCSFNFLVTVEEQFIIVTFQTRVAVMSCYRFCFQRQSDKVGTNVVCSKNFGKC